MRQACNTPRRAKHARHAVQLRCTPAPSPMTNPSLRLSNGFDAASGRSLLPLLSARILLKPVKLTASMHASVEPAIIIGASRRCRYTPTWLAVSMAANVRCCAVAVSHNKLYCSFLACSRATADKSWTKQCHQCSAVTLLRTATPSRLQELHLQSVECVAYGVQARRARCRWRSCRTPEAMVDADGTCTFDI